MTHRLALALALLGLAGCSPAARQAAAVAALDCGAPLVGTTAPDTGSLVGAAACWLGKLGPTIASPAEPSPELGEAVVEAAEAVEAEREAPLDLSARRATDEALGRCSSLATVHPP